MGYGEIVGEEGSEPMFVGVGVGREVAGYGDIGAAGGLLVRFWRWKVMLHN